jgi:hypothetical protein
MLRRRFEITTMAMIVTGMMSSTPISTAMMSSSPVPRGGEGEHGR